MPRILVVEGPLKGQSFEISDGATVGRSRSCAVRIEGRHVSRVHCKFEKRGEVFHVLDNDSRNGIFVNGHKVKEKPLTSDDEVEVGEYVLVFEPSPELVAAVSGTKAGESSPPAAAPAPGAWQAVVQPQQEEGTSRRDFARLRAATTVLDSIVDPFSEPVAPASAPALVDVVRAMQSTEEDTVALKALLDTLVDGLKATRGFVMLTDDRGKLTPAVKRAPANDDEFYLSNVLFHQIAREKRAVLATDTTRKGAAAGKPMSILAAPMVSRGSVIGFVYLEAPADEGTPPKPKFAPGDLRLAAVAAALAAPVIALQRRAAKSGRAYDAARRRLEAQYKIVGETAPIKQVVDMLSAIAPTEAAVLIMGEKGTGKSLVAQALHIRGPRALLPFVSVNCASIPPSLVAAELFGYEKNAFPGAADQKKGLLELAHGGTLYLEEVGELPQEAQAVLLRVLEGHSFTRVGGSDRIHVDVRMVGATTHDLEKEMQEGKIKKELYWNLAGTVLKIPPLRERREDIPRLIRHFLEVEGGRTTGTLEDHVAPDALQALNAAPWTGNVAELRSVIQQMMLAGGSGKLAAEHWRR